MHWINFHIKHTAASQCSIIHLAVWTMRKLSRNFSPYSRMYVGVVESVKRVVISEKFR